MLLKISIALLSVPVSNVKEHASNAQACSCTGVRCLGMGDYNFVCVNITSEKIY